MNLTNNKDLQSLQFILNSGSCLYHQRCSTCPFGEEIDPDTSRCRLYNVKDSVSIAENIITRATLLGEDFDVREECVKMAKIYSSKGLGS